jgi:GAF domain-containing protein
MMEHLLGFAPDSPASRSLRLLLRLAVTLVGADAGSLLVHDPAAGDLCFVITEGAQANEAALRGRHVPLGHGPVGLAAATREVHTGAPVFRDIGESERLAAAGPQPEAEIAAPVLVEDRLFGVLTAVAFGAGRRFGSQEAQTYGGFAAIAGVLVEQAQRLHPGADLPPHHAGAAERRIQRALQRLATHRPEAMTHLAGIVEQVCAAVLESDGK